MQKMCKGSVLVVLAAAVVGCSGAGDPTQEEVGVATAAMSGDIVSPTPGSVFSGASETFTWEACAYDNWFYAGSSSGSNDYEQSGTLGPDVGTFEATSLPTDGSTVYVRVYCKTAEGSPWTFNEYTYTAFGDWISSPAPGATLTGTTETFTFGSFYNSWLLVGTSKGAYDIHNSGELGNATSDVVAGLPGDGSTVYARMYRKKSEDSPWEYKDYTYTAWSESNWITSPAPGSTLSGTSETFSWDAATNSWLFAGTTQGAHDLYNSGDLGTASAVTATGLPGDGSTVFIRLYKRAAPEQPWDYRDYTYKAFSESPWITSPLPGATLAGTTETFSWEAAGLGSYLYVGSTQGGTEYYQSADLGTASSQEVMGLPTDGSTVYVRIYKKESASQVWGFRDYMYTASM